MQTNSNTRKYGVKNETTHKLTPQEIKTRVMEPAMVKAVAEFMTHISQQQLHDLGYAMKKTYNVFPTGKRRIHRIELIKYNPDTIQYGRKGNVEIPLPDYYILTPSAYDKFTENVSLIHSVKFRKAAAWILEQVYSGN